MNTVLWVFIAIAFGLMLFTSLQEKLPEELSFLKSTPGAEVTAAPAGAASGATVAARTFNYEGWLVRQSGATVELVKGLSGKLEANGDSFDTPQVGILCSQGKLDLRVDTRLATTGTASTPVSLGASTQAWQKGTGRNIFPPNPVDTVRALAASSGPVTMTLSFVDLGKRSVALDPAGLKALVDQLPATCR